MFYHLTTMKIRIIKKIHIKQIVKVGHENPGFAFFLGRREYATRSTQQTHKKIVILPIVKVYT